MALNIRNPEAEKLVMELSRQTGESKTEAVTKALRDRLADELEEIAEHCANLPVLDARRPEEILGYDEIGVPR